MSIRFYIEPYPEDDWIRHMISFFPHTTTTLEECDFIVSTTIPYGCINVSFIQQVLDSYRDSSKRVLVFLLSDYNEPLDVPSKVLLFRSGMYRSKRKPNEYLIPYIWVRNELQGDPMTYPFPATRKPTIGFCGSITSHPCRIQHINYIKRAPDIKTNFILRTDYWAGKPHDPTVVQEFIKNIQNNHLTLCSRGAGNWSARFYQVLSLGRIPVVVNTDMILPFENHIHWKDKIVLCNDEKEITNAIRQFWNTNDIVQAQQECKQLYDAYLAPEKWCDWIVKEVLIPLLSV